MATPHVGGAAEFCSLSAQYHRCTPSAADGGRRPLPPGPNPVTAPAQRLPRAMRQPHEGAARSLTHQRTAHVHRPRSCGRAPCHRKRWHREPVRLQVNGSVAAYAQRNVQRDAENLRRTYTSAAVATDNLATRASGARPSPDAGRARAPPAATFVAIDTITQGTWKGKYGTDGVVLSRRRDLPAYDQVAPAAEQLRSGQPQPATGAPSAPVTAASWPRGRRRVPIDVT